LSNRRLMRLYAWLLRRRRNFKSCAIFKKKLLTGREKSMHSRPSVLVKKATGNVVPRTLLKKRRLNSKKLS